MKQNVVIRTLALAVLFSCSPCLVGQTIPDADTINNSHLQGLAAPAMAVQSLVATPSLTTLFAGGNSQNGNMFDIQATKGITITSFDIHLSTSYPSTPMEVYYKVGTSVGFQTNPGAWTLLGSAVVTSLGNNVPTPLPIGGLNLIAGQRYGLYITSTMPIGNGVLRYTNGITDYSNSDLTIFHGFGKVYPFGSTFSPRIWNGTIYYRVSMLTFLDDYGRSRMCLDGTTGDFIWMILSGPGAGTTYTGTAVVTNLPLGSPVLLQANSKPGDPFNLAFSFNKILNTAYANFSIPSSGVASVLADKLTTDDPQGCSILELK